MTTKPDYIITTLHNPPAPIGSFWTAYDDRLGADESPYGMGLTEQEAVEDLLVHLEGMA
jgi:hypothetical protein